jgi:cellulose synthase/poly-beta-1,6-N-acetylglucosamine synthase-like glycosyltransferase
MEILFWLSLLFVCYVYFGYPLLLASARRVLRRPINKKYWEPAVSIVIAAYNERESLGKKIQNCLSLDYPKQKLQIIISLDGSTDSSEFLLRTFVSQGVTVVQSRSHHGKAAALNRAMRHATGEIIVFADVRQTFHPAAIRELAAKMQEKKVTLVDLETPTRGKAELFDALREFLAEPPSAGEYPALALKLNMTEGSLRVAVHRLRQRYRALLREEIAQTVEKPAAVDDEIQQLFAALS